ncbi:MAG: Holliday junction resolvase RuvX [Gemmatimonadota bacterium]
MSGARILAIDYGERRIGLAISDPSATIAQPLPTLVRRAGKRPPVSQILEIIHQNDVAEAVVGLPLSLAGEDTDWTREVRAFAKTLRARAGINVDLLDERLTSVRAERAVRELGLKKSQREQKERIDSAAALLLLQMHLDRKKTT